eukprot:TRINITY_DN4796_c0_g3_i6.p1 TRINITY_DN4796_c0_g3~~TRINITY_DN4796_c0_g3_i6.p1  ORF type:complete len:438 (+),score=97.42 TRINITY_DN4796_c0_g3_i6:188-1501(+)
MDSEDFLQEFRCHNSDLLQLYIHLTISFTFDVVNKLLDYVIEEPGKDADEKRAYRYPFYAAEAFNCEVSEMIDLLFAEKKETGTEPTMSETQAGIKEDNEEAVYSSKLEKIAEAKAPAKPLFEEDVGAIDGNFEKNSLEPDIEINIEGKDNDNLGMEIEESLASNNKELIEEIENACEGAHEEVKLGRCELLEKLLSFLNSEEELNFVLAGYFAKVIQAIIGKRKLDLLHYLFLHKEHIDNFVRHCYNKSIAEALYKLISNEDKFTTGIASENFLAEKEEILDRLIENISGKNDEMIANSSVVLTNLVDSRQYIEYFLSAKTIARLFQIVVEGSPKSLEASLNVLTALVKAKLSTSPSFQPSTFRFFTFEGKLSHNSPETKKEKEMDISALTKEAALNIPKLKQYLENLSVCSIVILGNKKSNAIRQRNPFAWLCPP